MKLLLWSVIVLVIVAWLFRSKKNSAGTNKARSDTTAKANDAKATPDGVEPMLPCAHCGVHVPASEAVISSSGVAFCSQEHRLGHANS